MAPKVVNDHRLGLSSSALSGPTLLKHRHNRSKAATSLGKSPSGYPDEAEPKRKRECGR
jgi:hypothetical protein